MQKLSPSHDASNENFLRSIRDVYGNARFKKLKFLNNPIFLQRIRKYKSLMGASFSAMRKNIPNKDTQYFKIHDQIPWQQLIVDLACCPQSTIW